MLGKNGNRKLRLFPRFRIGEPTRVATSKPPETSAAGIAKAIQSGCLVLSPQNRPKNIVAKRRKNGNSPVTALTLVVEVSRFECRDA